MWDNIIFANDETIDDITAQDKVSVVGFFIADHLRCRRQAHIFHELALTHGDAYNFVAMDVVECPETVKRFGVTDVPAMVFVRANVPLGGYNGVVKDKHRDELIERLAVLQKTPLEEQFVEDR